MNTLVDIPALPSKKRIPTSSNLHKQLETWISDFKMDGITLSVRSAKNPSPPTPKRISRVRTFKDQTIEMVTGLKNICGSLSRVDLYIAGKQNTLLLHETAEKLGGIDGWGILQKIPTETEQAWLTPLTQQTFTLMLENYLPLS